MEVTKFIRSKAIRSGWLLMTLAAIFLAAQGITAQTNGQAAAKASVTRIDEKQFPEILKPKGKPLLINFWATWCGPCREEFPDLVKIDADYKGKIDFITVTLDFEEELNTGVPKFLADMKATMPTYLLVTPDETTAIALVSKDWSGALPLTILYDRDGKAVFTHQGVVKPAALKAEIDKLLAKPSAALGKMQIVELPLYSRTKTEEEGVQDAVKDIASRGPKLFVYGLMPSIVSQNLELLKTKYKVIINGTGCFVPIEGEEYARGYNRTVVAALKKQHGKRFEELVSFISH